MAAYNSVNGHTMTESPMLNDILKDEWGFDGLVVSDWRAARTIAAAQVGLDLVMPGPSGPWGPALVGAVRQGLVSEAAIDDKVLRLLRLAARVGALNHGACDRVPEPDQAAESWTTERARQALRSTAAAGFVLAPSAAAASSSFVTVISTAPGRTALGAVRRAKTGYTTCARKNQLSWRLATSRSARYGTGAAVPAFGSAPADARGLRLLAGFRHAV